MRIINLRLSLFCFVAMCFGVFAAVECIYGNLWVPIVLFAAFAIIIVLICVFKRNKWYIPVVACAFALLGVLLTYMQLFAFGRREIVSEKVTLTGRVSDVGRNGNAVNKLYLEDCATEDYRLPGRVEMYVYDGASFATGDTVTVVGTLRSKYVFRSDVDTYSLRNRTYYNIEQDSLFVVGHGKLRFAEKVRRYVYDVCTEYGDEQSSGVLYALITGDRNAIAEDAYASFYGAGIVHLLAVSGLHVGVVAALFVGLVRLLKLHPAAELAIALVPLVAYAWLCGFSPSVVRAVVMFACVYIARMLLGKTDLLTSLSWAGLVLLCVQPLYLYDVGFQLSFLSVFGIATLYTPLSRKISQSRIPGWLRPVVNSLAMSVSCTAATVCALLDVYGETTLIGIVVNVFAIPMVSLAFVFALVGMLPWIFHFFVYPASWLADGVIVAAKFFTQNDFTRFGVAVSVLTAVVTIVWMFVAGGFVRLGRKANVITNVVLAAAFAATMIFAAVPKPCRTEAYVSVDFSEPVAAMTSDDGEAVIVTNFPKGLYALGEVLPKVYRHNVRHVTWCVTNYNAVDVESLSMCVNAGDDFFVLDSSGNDPATEFLAGLGITPVYGFKNLPMGKSVTVTPVYDGSLRAALLSCDNFSVAVVVGGDTAVANFAYARRDIDIYVGNKAFASYGAENKTFISLYQNNYPFNLGANKYGNFTIRPKDGTINVSFR